MEDLLLYFSLKYNGNFEKVYNALMFHESMDRELYVKLKEKLKYDYITILDDDYPEVLKTINCPPLVLFYSGDKELLKKKCYTVIGTDSYEQTSLSASCDIVTGIVKKSCAVVSSIETELNRGIHGVAYRANRRSICILPYMGYGNDNVFRKETLSGCGLILSESPFEVSGDDLQEAKYNLCRIMVGLSEDVVVIECDLKYTLDEEIIISLCCAVDQDKGVYCVPISVNKKNQGTNELIQNGAKLLIKASDIESL